MYNNACVLCYVLKSDRVSVYEREIIELKREKKELTDFKLQQIKQKVFNNSLPPPSPSPYTYTYPPILIPIIITSSYQYHHHSTYKLLARSQFSYTPPRIRLSAACALDPLSSPHPHFPFRAVVVVM